MYSFSENDKKMMREAQLNECARYRKKMGEMHPIVRSPKDWIDGVLLCKDCQKKTRPYGQRKKSLKHL